VKRSWLGVAAEGDGSTLAVPGVTGSVQNLAVKVNKASGTGATPLDWRTAITPSPLDLFGDVVSASGELTNLDIFGLLTGAAFFSLQRKVVDANVNGGVFDPTKGDLKSATLVTFGLSLDETNPGDPADKYSLRVGPADFGVEILNGTLAVASLAPADAADARRWIAVQAENLGATLALQPLVDARLEDVKVQINRATGLASV